MSVAVRAEGAIGGQKAALRYGIAARLIASLLDRVIAIGRLEVRLDQGPAIIAGGSSDGPDVAIRLHGLAPALLLATDPEFELGELYASGRLTIEAGTIDGLMELVGRNLGAGGTPGGLSPALNQIAQALDGGNSRLRAGRNARFHYDLSEEMYRAFLDADMQYSCAYFGNPAWDLDTAQLAKKLHIASKLRLRPGQRVLDIGCGWGGLALTLARLSDVEVTGITLSPEQLAVARERAEKEHVADRVRFELIDYRELEGRFDRIVSVGMLEHVGKEHFGAFFKTVERLLTDDGVALIHSIGRRRAAGGTDRWIRKRIFPGSYLPAMSELAAAVERTGLWITDTEVLRLHYAETLKRWRERFVSGCDCLRLEDPRFFRTWMFYLASCEMAFRYNGLMVMQLQLARGVAALPVTRDYMLREEELLAAGSRPFPALPPRATRELVA